MASAEREPICGGPGQSPWSGVRSPLKLAIFCILTSMISAKVKKIFMFTGAHALQIRFGRSVNIVLFDHSIYLLL
jgi:hypothetical protein